MSKDLKLNSIQWADFTLSQVFPFIMRGKRLIERNRKKGNIPYYSASKENNGLTDIIENPLFIEKDKLIISTLLEKISLNPIIKYLTKLFISSPLL